MAQDPPGESTVSREMEVSILVSLGPDALTFVTPSLVGKPFAQARASLQEYGVQVGAVRTVKEPGTEAEAIVAQNPAPGTPLTRREVVQVSVNRP
jgi:beta-lactam-binding protein with PASTA domain